MSGFAARRRIEEELDEKKAALNEIHVQMPAAARMLLTTRQASPEKYVADDEDSLTLNEDNETRIMDAEAKVELYTAKKDAVTKLEERLKTFLSKDHYITFKDVEALLKYLGNTMSKKQIEQIIWEVDDKNDGHICYDEFCLTYVRNVKAMASASASIHSNVNSDPAGQNKNSDNAFNEPSSFFFLVDFVIFEASGGQRKGYIIEDDCMEILYGRYGGGRLEMQMKLLFGSKLKASGGDGALNLTEYLSSFINRIGRRAIVT